MRAHNKQLLKKEHATENKQSYGAVTAPRDSAQLQINKICLSWDVHNHSPEKSISFESLSEDFLNLRIWSKQKLMFKFSSSSRYRQHPGSLSLQQIAQRCKWCALEAELPEFVAMATPPKVSLHVGVPTVFQQPVSSVKTRTEHLWFNICVFNSVLSLKENTNTDLRDVT